jgi:hypothetical protein
MSSALLDHLQVLGGRAAGGTGARPGLGMAA